MKFLKWKKGDREFLRRFENYTKLPFKIVEKKCSNAICDNEKKKRKYININIGQSVEYVLPNAGNSIS